jgi:hypothetical protein
MDSTDKNSKLTDAELLAWARTRTRMLVNRLKAMLVRGEVIPYEPMHPFNTAHTSPTPAWTENGELSTEPAGMPSRMTLRVTQRSASAQNIPGNVWPQLLAGHRFTLGAGGPFNRRTVLGRNAPGLREVRRHVASVTETECRGECRLAPEDLCCTQQSSFFGREVRVHGLSLTSFDLRVKGNLTLFDPADYGARMDSPAPPKKEPLDPVRRGIGQRLKTAREQKGMTQQEVATKFDVKKATVSAWETGAGRPRCGTPETPRPPLRRER